MPRIYAVTSGTSFTVPIDFNPTNNSIIVIGAGGGGSRKANGGIGGNGGGGGGLSRSTNVNLTPGGIVYISVGSGGYGGNTGTSNAGATGGDSWLNWHTANSTSVNAAPDANSKGLLAKGGEQGGTSGTAGSGGSAASGFGNILYTGGNGGAVTTTDAGGGGGGSAATITTNGFDGGSSNASTRGGGGGGGIGADGRTSSNTFGGLGGAGIANEGGAGGAGGTGSIGSPQSGRNGNVGTKYKKPSNTAYGPGGGAGGGGGTTVTSTWRGGEGGDGGLYGGGGGGGGGSFYTGAGGNGAQGVIILEWEPAIDVATIGANTSNTSTSSITLPNITASVGDMIIIGVSAKNSGTAGAAAMSSTACSDSAGNYWRNQTLTNNSPGNVTNDGITLGIWTTFVTYAMSNSTVTIAFSPNAQSKSITGFRVFSNVPTLYKLSQVETVGTANTDNKSAANGTFNSNTVAVSNSGIAFGFVANDNKTIYDPSNEWSAFVANTSSAGNGSSRIAGSYKQVDSLSTERLTVTGFAGDKGAGPDEWKSILQVLTFATVARRDPSVQSNVIG